MSALYGKPPRSTTAGDVQALVEAALTGDLHHFGWFRHPTPEAQELVARVVHMPATDPSDTTAYALMRMVGFLTGYEVMLGNRPIRWLACRRGSSPGCGPRTATQAPQLRS